MRNPENTIGNLIDRSGIAMVGSIDEDGFPNVKAMYAPRHRNGIRELYFTTNLSSLRVAQFQANPRACVYFCDRRFFRGVMLRGTMEVLTDAAHRELIWRDGDERYYPAGVSDPDYCVLRFTARGGRYYSSFRSGDFSISESGCS